MKKLIGITIVVSLLSSCGLTFGDYDHYQEVYGNKQCCAKTAQEVYKYEGLTMDTKPCIKSYCITLELNELEASVNELSYYVNEDVFNGNLNENVYEHYATELNKINKLIKELKNE